MSEVLRDLVVSLSLNSDNFSRNITSINRQVEEAESEFRRAAAGVDGFEKTVAGTQAQLSSLAQKFAAQKNAVAQYERALEAAKERIRTELYAQKFQMEKRQEWIKNLRENEAKIEILDPMLLGYSLAEKEKWAEAAQAYEKALTDKRYKNKLNTFLALANVYKEAKNFDAALNVFNRLPKEFANDFAVPMVKAEIYAAQEKKEEAKQALLEAQAKAGDELMLLRQVLEKMQELGLTAETEALQEKIEALEAKFQAEQEELTRIILEEQERINSQQSEIFETPSAEN